MVNQIKPIIMDNFSSLNEKHLIYEKLNSENLAWWKFVKDNIKLGTFYVDIRKDNTLNVYYNGGSLIKISLSEGKLKCMIHEFYLSQFGSKYIRIDPNDIVYDVDKLKSRIDLRYSNSSENGIKAKLICNPNSTFIDSEFAYSSTRIDMTKIENGEIVFVELKLIQDRRLLTNEYEHGEPEILKQIKEYNKFISTYKQEIMKYYYKLFTIKRNLDILPNSLSKIENINEYDLRSEVELYIEPYPYLNSKRKKRIDAIKNILDKNNIINNL